MIRTYAFIRNSLPARVGVLSSETVMTGVIEPAESAYGFRQERGVRETERRYGSPAGDGAGMPESERREPEAGHEENAVSMAPDYAEVKMRIAPRLINYEKYKEPLQKIPYVRREDLAVIFYCYLVDRPAGAFMDNPEFATAVIDNADMARWGMGREELFSQALRSAERYLPATFETIQQVIGRDAEGEAAQYPSLYVLSNDRSMYGASAVLYPGILRRVAKKLGEEYYLIPSSVHEMLVLPKSQADNAGILRSIVREVNEYELQEPDILSDNVYLYDREIDTFRIAR